MCKHLPGKTCPNCAVAAALAEVKRTHKAQMIVIRVIPPGIMQLYQAQPITPTTNTNGHRLDTEITLD